MRSTPRTTSPIRRLRALLGAATAIVVGATLAATVVATPAGAATSSPWLKPVLGGPLDRQHEPDQAFRGVVDGHVVEVAWADLQPVANGPLVANNKIDQAVANARAKGLKLKLRVFAGTSAPDRAKRLDGSPVPVQDTYGRAGTIGRFWTPRFGQAYLQLQRNRSGSAPARACRSTPTSAMKTLGGPIGFQTAIPDKIGDLNLTLRWALQQGAAHVELPISYKTDASPTSLLTYNRQLINNTTS